MNTFIRASVYRAIRTVCQTAVATISVYTTGEIMGLADINWPAVISASILAGILSILTSVATGLPEVTLEESLYMNADEPADSEVPDHDD